MRRAVALVLAPIVAAASLIAWWLVRPNQAAVDPQVVLESWAAISDDMHNSNTDLAWWRGSFYLVHDRRPYHFASPDAVLWVHRSSDGRRWERVAEMRVPGNDVRDPKLAVIGDRLHLYALPNRALEPRPYGTIVATTEDGVAWSAFEDVDPTGWLLWHPRTLDGRTWWAPAYIRGMGRSALFASDDGRTWREVSTILDGDGASETAAAFLPDGRLVATVRRELDVPIFGSSEAGTELAVAAPPYREWRRTTSRTARLDGPCLFEFGARIYGIGRRDADAPGFLVDTGSILGRKRTAIFSVEPERLTWLTDLPSAGDTSYAGCVVRGDELWTSYYTSDVRRDPPWILGMVKRSEVRIARVDLRALADAAGRQSDP